MLVFWSWKMSRFLTKILNDKPGEVKPKLEVIPKVDQTHTNTEDKPKPHQTHTKSTPNPSQTLTSSRPVTSKAVAPERDFNKRANILEREALPNGLFPGASKAIYDALYLRTLGSINPKRTVQTTRKELMKWSGIKNIKTINAHLKRLKDLELIKLTNFTGEHTGSHYEVFLPREGTPDQTQTSQTEGIPESDQKLDPDQYQKMVWVGLGKDIDNKQLNTASKTSLKTNTNDDEFTQKLNEICLKITGRELSKSDRDKLPELAELLGTEAERAAKHSKGVSAFVPYLIRVVESKLTAQTAKKGSPKKIDTVGKHEGEVKPLSEIELAEQLEIYRELKAEKGMDEIEKRRDWFTPKDWENLMKELGEK